MSELQDKDQGVYSCTTPTYEAEREEITKEKKDCPRRKFFIRVFQTGRTRWSQEFAAGKLRRDEPVGH
jgi:hypothetical protein